MLVPQSMCLWHMKRLFWMWVPVCGGRRLGCIQGCELSNTTRMVTRAFARKTLVLVQPLTSRVVTVVCGSHATLRIFINKSFLHRSWCSAQVMLEESTGFGFLCCLVDMLIPRCVFMERYASVLGSVSFC